MFLAIKRLAGLCFASLIFGLEAERLAPTSLVALGGFTLGFCYARAEARSCFGEHAPAFGEYGRRKHATASASGGRTSISWSFALFWSSLSEGILGSRDPKDL